VDLSPDDLRKAASCCRGALEPFVDSDWSMTAAGDLEWDVRTTIAHVCDAVGWYAAHLAAESRRRLRFDFAVHRDASNIELLDVLGAAAATLALVATAAGPNARGFHNAGMADTSGFIAMACDEILVHCWDSAYGFGSDFAPPVKLAEHTLRRLFPWAPTSGQPWATLLWANGRIGLPERPRLSGDWVWHCPPLDEWDGTVPRWDGDTATRFEWNENTARWHPAT
jgi:hypothetical protein